jgi:hypothetical protein
MNAPDLELPACPREGPHAERKERALTREEVLLEAARPAWAGLPPDQGPEFFYNGTRFWNCGLQSRSQLAPQQTPRLGWWHRALCDCSRCRSSRGVAPQEA